MALKGKLFAFARHFNLWISYELGRTRVKLPTARIRLSLFDTSNRTKDILSFLNLSDSLDNEHIQSVSTLEKALTDIANIEDPQPPMILTQWNMMLYIYRRLQYLGVLLLVAC